MKTILVVEDSRTQAERMRAGLTDAGFSVVAAANGEIALQRLAEAPVDLVLSDIVMPRMDGYELCRQIKDTRPELPVILLTSLTDPLDVVQGLLAGADNFFRKPYDLEYLVSRLRGILYNREMRTRTRSNMGLELHFLGRRFTITAERQQLLDLLISTFEDLVTTNEQLRDREKHLAEAHTALAGRLEETDRERQRLRAVLAALPVGMVVVDEHGEVAEANHALLELVGRHHDDVVGRPMDDMCVLVDQRGQRLPPELRPLSRALAGDAAAEVGGSFDVFVHRPLDGGRFPVVAKAAPIYGLDGSVTGAVKLLHSLVDLAAHHSLTGLPTHSLLVDRLRQAAELSASRQLLSAVLVVAVDRVARIREAGQAVYDDVVRATADRLKSVIDDVEFDERTQGACLAYLDDGEFAIVLTGLRREVDAVRLAELAIDAASGNVQAAGTDVDVRLSAGVAVWAEEQVDAPHLIAASVQAARLAERNGGQHVELAATALQEQLLSRLQLESELRHAISAGELTVHYQPQLTLSSGRVSGIEALVRWQHPQRGLVPPGDFIPLAEESGLVVPLGQHVLREACSQAAAWRRDLVDARDLVISVNLASAQLSDPDIAHHVAGILKEADLEPQALLLEITETAAMTDAEAVGQRLQELKALGVQLAIDDFGTGYSSLLQLRRFPLDTLKVDRSFVMDMLDEPTAATIVDASVRLGVALGLEVVAEGVETREQAEALLGLGCQVGQGFLWSRALAAPDFARWWDQREPIASWDLQPRSVLTS